MSTDITKDHGGIPSFRDTTTTRENGLGGGVVDGTLLFATPLALRRLRNGRCGWNRCCPIETVAVAPAAPLIQNLQPHTPKSLGQAGKTHNYDFLISLS
jgi:hypothetical protein